MAGSYYYSDYAFRVDDDDEEDEEAQRTYRKKKKINKGRWTKAEDEKLKDLAGEYGPSNWKDLASKFPDRTDTQCQQRWQKVLNPELIKGPWTKEEDEKVVELVAKYGPKKWSLIAQHLTGRIGKQCRERWHNHLNPHIKKSAWTEEEDRMIYEAHKKLGNKWAEIAKVIPGRTDNAIKNHWNSTMRRRVESFGFDHYKKNRYTSEKSKHGRPSSAKKERRKREEIYREIEHEQQLNNLPVGMTVASPTTVVVAHGNVTQSDALPVGLTNSTESLTSIRPKQSVNQTSIKNANKGSSEHPGIVSPFRSYILSQSLLDSDPTTWGDLSTFENGGNGTITKSNGISKLTSPGARGYRFDGNTIAGLNSDGPCVILGNKILCFRSLIPITSPVLQSRFSTPPTILRRGKKRKVLDASDPATSSSTTSTTEPCESIFSSPKNCTPIKSLPFSPSQFLNSPGCNKIITSTPTEQKPTSTSTSTTLNTPVVSADANNNEDNYRTPKVQRSWLQISPRTPTPFKNALKILNETKMAHTPAHFDEDFSEIIKKEAEESGVSISCSAVKESTTKARTSLCKRMEDNMDLVMPSLFSVREEPSTVVESSTKNVARTVSSKTEIMEDSGIVQTSLLMSPTQDPAIVKPSEVFGKQNPFVTPSTNLSGDMLKTKKKNLMRPLQFQETPRKCQVGMDTTWEQVACGKTPDQQFVTEQAKNFIANYRTAARTLQFSAPTVA